MTAPATSRADTGARPFTAFRFLVEIRVEGIGDGNLCAAAFSEVDGLDMTIEPKTIREGGNNIGPVHLVGQVSYGQLTLKRGMTSNLDLWRWFARVVSPGYHGVRADADIVMLSSDGASEQARFQLQRCLPTKLKAPALNAKEGVLAIEELQLVYESLSLRGAEEGA